MSVTGAAGPARAARGRPTGAARTTEAACPTRTGGARSIPTGSAGIVGEGGLEQALQFGGLVAGQLAR